MIRKLYCVRQLWLSALVFIVMTGIVSAGDNNVGKVGLSAAVGDGSVNIMFPVWAGRSLVLRPSIGYINTDRGAYYDIGPYTSNRMSQLALDMLFRFNMSQGEAVPYLGFHFGGIISSVDSFYRNPYYDYSYRKELTLFDGVIGLAAGGEYFLKDRFSLGVEAQLNLTLYDSVTSAVRLINSATFVLGTFYF